MAVRIMLAALLLWGLGACRGVLRGGLSEQQANDIVVALDSAAIPAAKIAETFGSPTTFRIEIANADTARALRVLQDRGLPQTDESGIETAYSEPALVPTPQEERARWTTATARDLERSLHRLEGVQDAHVHIALPECARPLDGAAFYPKGSVLIRRRKGMRPIDVDAVRKLVAGAIDGLAAEQVTVVQTESTPPAASAPSFVRIGPVTVTADSAPALRMLLGGALAVDLMMAVVLIWALRRRRKRV